MKKIYFFNGWAMDNNVVAHLLNSTEYEVKIINFPYILNKNEVLLNEKIIFIAWSFGVYYLNKFLNENKEIKNYRTIAINGNPQLIGNYGINQKMFDLTLNTLNEENLEKFYENMDIDDSFKRSEKNFESIKEELKYFKDNYCQYEKDLIDYYFIFKNDRIIPAAKQKKYCVENNKKYLLVNGGHYPFSYFKDFKEIIYNDGEQNEF